MLFPFGNITVVSEHNLGSACGSQPLCYQENKKKDKEIKMMEIMSSISSPLRSKGDLIKEVKHRKVEKINETTLGFQDEEGPCTSYQQKKDLILHRAPKKHTMPFSFGEEDKRHGYGGHLDHEILNEYIIEYKSQPRAFKENLNLP